MRLFLIAAVLSTAVGLIGSGTEALWGDAVARLAVGGLFLLFGAAMWFRRGWL